MNVNSSKYQYRIACMMYRDIISTSKYNYTAAEEAAVAFPSLIVIELRFIALIIISWNHAASLVI